MQREEHPSTRERERERKSTCTRGRERKSAWAPPFICFSSPWACPVQIGLSQESCSFYLKSSLWSSDPPLTFLVFLATAILDSISLFYLRNIPPSRDGRPNSLGIGASRSFWLLPAELGRRGVLGLPLVLVSSLRVLQWCPSKGVIFSMVGCSFPSLLNWHCVL